MESFEEVAAQYEPMIHKIIQTLHIYKNKDEFFQLGLISLWEAWTKFDAEKGKFTSFAYIYIKGGLLSELSKNTLLEERNISQQEEFWETIEGPSSQPGSREILLSYCENLTAHQTKWVLYTCLEDLTIQEIAEKEQVSISAVKAWRKGALQKLKTVLQIVNAE